VAANALAITLTGAGGTALSATNKAQFAFRSATATDGATSVVDATADLTLTISSGSSLGTSNGVAARFWLVVFNDAGTLRLGAVNCSTATAIYPLADDVLASSTAEGGAGAADSAGVIYTGTAVTSKAMRVLGYLELTEATAGTYATAHTKLQLWQPGMKLPGDVVQYQHDIDSAYATTSVEIPVDDTIPQNTEGAEFMAVTITPTSGINHLDITVSAMFGNTSLTSLIGALFQDATANALHAVPHFYNGAGGPIPGEVSFRHRKLAGTTSATTFKFRAGASTATAAYFNGTNAARLFGGASNSLMSVTEIVG
jgi:hypothetical protein